jgi:hypothetical protein
MHTLKKLHGGGLVPSNAVERRKERAKEVSEGILSKCVIDIGVFQTPLQPSH